MRRTSVHRTAAALALGLLVALLAASTASAGQLSNEGGWWIFRAAPGERNDFRAGLSELGRPGYLMFHDTGVTLGVMPDGCYREGFDMDDPGTMRCPIAGTLGIRAELADGDDWGIVSEDLPGIPVVFDGGPGNDRLNGPLRGVGVTFNGGDGNDELDGGDLADVLDGGPGNDRVKGDAGNDVVRGGDGDDLVEGDSLAVGADTIDGGPGYDRSEADWIQPGASAGMTITLDGVANDGHPGEGDNVVAMEEFTFTQPAVFVAGAEVVRVRIYNHEVGSSNVAGGPANDNLRTHDYNDTIDGKAGDDTIEGGYGDDTITGGPGKDTINAEAGTGSCSFLVCRVGVGNDTVNVRDGEVDSVVCGVGTDTVVADADDTIAADCETVDRGIVTPPRTEPRREPRREPSGKRCMVPKVKAGTKLAVAKRALAKKGCKAKTKKMRSKAVKKGRVVKLSHKAGKKLPGTKAVTVYVSRGRR